MHPLKRRLLPSLLLAAAASFSAGAHAQVAPAATGPLGLSAFGGVNGTFTGLNGGHNLGITAGLDLELPRLWRLNPSAEVRATYPFHPGHQVGEKNVLGGLRQDFHLGPLNHLHTVPYGDILFGWGRLAYPDGGHPSLDDTYQYFHTSSFVWGPGAGLDLRLTPRWSLRGDFQFDHYATPVTTSGDIWSKALTASVVYRFDRYHTVFPWTHNR